MLPEPIFNTYTQYKPDSLRIATWLASTAARCRYTPLSAHKANADNATNVDGAANGDGVDVKPQKLTGRAMKLAKEATVKDVQVAKEAEAARLKRDIEEAARKVVNSNKEGASVLDVNGNDEQAKEGSSGEK